jgi:hypothetical protein
MDRAVPGHHDPHQRDRILLSGGRLHTSHAVGIISLVFLAAALAARYAYRLDGGWRVIYVVGATVALYLNVFVAVVQGFQKVAFLKALAPTQSEPPFLIAQLVVLAIFIALGVLAARAFHPAGRALSHA